MSDVVDDRLLAALLDSWDRNNTILVNLLQLFAHSHFVRLMFVAEDVPECARPMPEGEWRNEPDRNRIAQWLQESARTVREAVTSRLQADREMAVHYDHPLLFLQHMIRHEGYHHGQIKLALKLTGQALADDDIGPRTWDVWMDKT